MKIKRPYSKGFNHLSRISENKLEFGYKDVNFPIKERDYIREIYYKNDNLLERKSNSMN